MHQHFKGFSISYKTTPLEIREKVALDNADAGDLLIKCKEVLGISEVLVVSTCNRTEIYYSSEVSLADEILTLLAVKKGISKDDLFQYAVLLEDQSQAIEHLFGMSMGLESQVVGDIQISNQVKRAYQMSADLELAGPFLHRLMHTIFFTNKRVVQETAFRDGAASVSYAAVEMLSELTNNLTNPKVLVVGLGEIGRDVVKNLENAEIDDITITNRTDSTAEGLAKAYGYKSIPFGEVNDALHQADVVISSVAKEGFFSKELVESHIHHFKYFIDLSVPRSVAQEVDQIAGALVYDVDDIHIRTNKALEKRLASVPDVKAIISESVAEFMDWSGEMVFSDTIHRFKEALEGLRQRKMAKYLKKMDEQEFKKADKLTKELIQDIVKLPVLELKAACKRGDAESLADVLQDLFDLEKVAAGKGK